MSLKGEHCLENLAKYGKIYNKKRRDKLRARSRNWLNKVKNVPCMDCGGTFPPVCMDFDHRPGTEKKAAVASLINVSLKAVIEEIDKCDLVCSNCHRIRTQKRREIHSA